MAYAFDRVMASIKKPEDDGKSSIFAAQGAAPGASIKRSAEGGEVGAPAGGGGAPATAPQQLPNSGGTKKQAIAKNVGKARSPLDLAQLRGGISGAKAGIQSETDNYLANAQQGQKLGDDARGGIKALLDTSTAGFKTPAAFPGHAPAMGEEPLPDIPGPDGKPSGLKPAHGGASDFYSPESWATFFGTGAGVQDDLDLETNTDFGNANLLRTDAGVGELFRRGGGAEYTGGDAAFDATLLRLDPKFQAERQSTLGALDDLNAEKARALGGGARNSAQGAAGGARKTAQDEARGLFEGGAASLEAQARERERLYDLGLGGGLSPAAQAEADRIMAELAADPELGKYAGTGGAPMAKGFFTAGSADDTNWQDFVNDDEGTIFGRIGTALGRDLGPVKGGSLFGKDARDNGTFDSEGYAAALRAAALQGKLGGAVSDSKPGAGDVPPSDFHPSKPGDTVTIHPEDDPTGGTPESQTVTLSPSDPEAEARVGAMEEGKRNPDQGDVAIEFDPNDTTGSGSGTTRDGPVPLLTTQPALKSRDAAGQVAAGDFAGARDTMNGATEGTLAVPGLVAKGVEKAGGNVEKAVGGAAPDIRTGLTGGLNKVGGAGSGGGGGNVGQNAPAKPFDPTKLMDYLTLGGKLPKPATKPAKVDPDKARKDAAAAAQSIVDKMMETMKNAPKVPAKVPTKLSDVLPALPPPPGGGNVPLPPLNPTGGYDPAQDPAVQALLSRLSDPTGGQAAGYEQKVRDFFSNWG